MPGSIRRARRIDNNQVDVVAALRGVGASVLHLHAIGKGAPDILVGFRGINVLIEIKSAKGTMTPDESAFVSGWLGQVCVAYSPEMALVQVEQVARAQGKI